MLATLNIAKIYLLSGISIRVYEPNEILFDKAHKVKKIDIMIKILIFLFSLIEKRISLFLFPIIVKDTLRYGGEYAWIINLPYTLCWGIGSAVGELPPYFAGKTLINNMRKTTRKN